MKYLFKILVTAGLLLAAAQPDCLAEQTGILFQYSTINALLSGRYDGDMRFAELARHGDFGIGTFNGLDGEMIALDGNFHQVTTDGRVSSVAPEAATPFAVVTFFHGDRSIPLPDGLDYQGVQKLLDTTITNHNLFQAVRIDGTFSEMTTRSVPAQKPPYLPLATVVAKQAVFHCKKIAGTLIGFATPNYVAGLNVPGYHFHFLSADRQQGGHVLELRTTSGRITLSEMRTFTMTLPAAADFATVDLRGPRRQEMEKVEKKRN